MVRDEDNHALLPDPSPTLETTQFTAVFLPIKYFCVPHVRRGHL